MALKPSLREVLWRLGDVHTRLIAQLEQEFDMGLVGRLDEVQGAIAAFDADEAEARRDQVANLAS